jgi:hypothetical protein
MSAQFLAGTKEKTGGNSENGGTPAAHGWIEKCLQLAL